jgi:tripartite ATP-independent transporter DctM subunit
MSPELIGLVSVVVLLVLIAARMHLGLAMAFIGIAGIALIQGIDKALFVAGQTPFAFIFNYSLAVLPMFTFMGMIVSETGIGGDLYYTVHKWIGHLRGGLAMATTGACALFAAITGGGMEGIIVMSKVALPEMQKFRYDDRLSTGVIASSATMGVLIPPSMGFILYAILTEQSVGKLFMAGIIPGILEALFYMVAIYSLCRVNPKMGPPGPRTSFREKVVSLKDIWPVLALFLLVMGGIYTGIFTPTEAGAIGAFGAIVIAMIMRRLSGRGFLHTLLETGLMTGMFLLMMIGVSILMKFMAISKLPFVLGDLIAGLHIPGMAVIIAIVIMYIILGCFMDALLAIIITLPIIYPVVLAMGFDPIWFGVIIVRMTEIGAITPPFGINVFILSGISGLPISTIYRGVVPFVLADFCHVALIIAVPALSLFLPSRM